MADPGSSSDDDDRQNTFVRELGLMGDSSSEDGDDAAAACSSSDDDDDEQSAPSKRGRPKVGKGGGSSRADYKQVLVKAFANEADAKEWRLAQTFKLRHLQNNATRTIWGCTSHETADGEPCPFQLAAFMTPGGGRVYWQQNGSSSHAPKLKDRAENEDGIDQRWLPFVNDSVRGGMTPSNIRARIIVMAQKDSSLEGTVPTLAQASPSIAGTPSRGNACWPM